MAKTVIVPLLPPERDNEDVSELALPVASAIAARNDASIVLVSVIEAGFPLSSVTGSADEELVTNRQSYLQQAAQSFPGRQVETVVRQDTDVAKQICAVVDEVPEPVVVMSSYARRGFHRAVVGSVAMEVVRAAACPVVVVPATTERTNDPIARLEIVLMPAVDLDAAHATIDAMFAVLGNDPLDVHLMGPGRTPAEYAEFGPDEADRIDDQIMQGLDALSGRLNAAGHKVTLELALGEVEGSIVMAAKDMNADIIAMTTRARTGVQRLILGSVAETVLRDGRRPVLLTRIDEAGEPA